MEEKDGDWCMWSCTDSRIGNVSFYDEETAGQACSYWDHFNAAKEAGADVRLATKGVAQEHKSNAAYYIAGASLVGAAAIAVMLMSKKEQKANETPLLAVDDEFKAHF